MNNTTSTKDEENLSIIERIMIKTGNPKIAAVLALDLFLVGVDTVSNMHRIWMKIYHHTSAFNVCGHMLKHTCDSIHTPCGVCLLCTHSGLCTDKFLSFFSFHTNAFFKLDFFFAIQTSVAATSTIYQLSQNPDKQEILYNELKSIMPDVRSPVDTKILEQMPFLRACIKETLRYITLCSQYVC